jgi:hypothetical protein
MDSTKMPRLDGRDVERMANEVLNALENDRPEHALQLTRKLVELCEEHRAKAGLWHKLLFNIANSID